MNYMVRKSKAEQVVKYIHAEQTPKNSNSINLMP